MSDKTIYTSVSEIVKTASRRRGEDYEKIKADWTANCVQGIKDISRQMGHFLKMGRKKVVINVNQHLNNAPLPCDFEKIVFLGIIDEYGNKVPLLPKGRIADIHNLEEIPCDTVCEEKCTGCYDKALCNELNSVQEIKNITVNGQPYKEKIITTLQPDGSYHVITMSWEYSFKDNAVIPHNTEKYITKFDTNACGCIKKTDSNSELLKTYCYNHWCCYCSPASESPYDNGGYNIFEDSGVIQFESYMPYNKLYMEYVGSLPKSGNDYLIPEVAFEMMVDYVIFISVKSKKGNEARADMARLFDNYMRSRGNMKIIISRRGLNLSRIMSISSMMPVFVNDSICYHPVIKNRLENA